MAGAGIRIGIRFTLPWSQWPNLVNKEQRSVTLKGTDVSCKLDQSLGLLPMLRFSRLRMRTQRDARWRLEGTRDSSPGSHCRPGPLGSLPEATSWN